MASDDCVIYLQAKIVGSGKGHLSSLGFMTEEDVRQKILMSNFTKVETRSAINEACALDMLDMHYKVECSNCGQVSYILEKDFADKKTASEVTKTGFCCRHCQHFEKAAHPLDRVYCINQSYLGGWEEGDESEVSPLKRLFTTILRKLRSSDG